MFDFLYLSKTVLNDRRTHWLKENHTSLYHVVEKYIKSLSWIRQRFKPIIQDKQGALTMVSRPKDAETMRINLSPGTPTASVHESVSTSASKLLEQYGWILNQSRLHRLLTTISTWTKDLKTGDLINDTAKICIERITAADYHFTDQGSTVNVHQLLALCWLAIHHQELRQGSLMHAQRQFCEGLYKIQRGHSLSARGIDEGGPDSPLCKAETFNTLVESIDKIHPAVNIIYVNPKIAGFKLSAIVKEEALRYLEENTNPSTALGFVNITATLKQLEKNGVSAIWDAIKVTVANRIYNEFSSLFKDKEDQRFRDLIDTGLLVELGTLPSFQKILSESVGYKDYCRAALRSHGLFSQNNRTPCKDRVHDKVPTTSPGM